MLILASSINFLNITVTVKIDRPMGSTHPKWKFIYPVNYGFIPNTICDDGEELGEKVI